MSLYYTKQEERISGFFNFNQNNTDEIVKWFKQKTDLHDYDIFANEVFNNSRDQLLKNLLKQKKMDT